MEITGISHSLEWQGGECAQVSNETRIFFLREFMSQLPTIVQVLILNEISLFSQFVK